MRNYDLAKKFYEGLTKEAFEANIGYHPNFAEDTVNEDEVTRLSRIVFAPDETGNPTSDIEYYLNAGDDGFREYMRRVLLQRVEGDISNDDPDLVESTIKRNCQTYEEYFRAMDAYARDQINNNS